MAPHGGGQDYVPYTDPRVHVDPEAAWTKVDLGLIAFLVLLPIIGLVFGI